MMQRRGNMLAVLVLVALALTSIALYTLHSYSTLQTTAQGQQIFLQAEQAAGESVQAAIYRLLQRGYNNTAARDTGELWYCNAPLPPTLQEVDESLQILIEEELARLMQQFEMRGITASAPTITSFTANSIADLPEDSVHIRIENFEITQTTDDGEQSILLEADHRYPLPAWGMLQALDTWTRCGAGYLSEEILTVLNQGQCLFESCCCGAVYDLEDMGSILAQQYGVHTQQEDLEEAINASVQRLQALLNGAPSCDDTQAYEDLTSPVTCTARIQLSTNDELHYSTEEGTCEGEYNCLFRGLGSPTQPFAGGVVVDNYCISHRTPQSGGIGTTVNPPDTTVPSLGANVNYNRVAIDKYVEVEITLECTHQEALVFVDNDFRPLRTSIDVIASIHNACEADAPSDDPPVDYSQAVCLTAGGGDECPECTGPCTNPPENMCDGQGRIFAPICNAQGEFQNSCGYQPCAELFCSPGVACCDGTVAPVEFTCVEGRGCVPLSPAQACQPHGGVDDGTCAGDGPDEGEDSGENPCEDMPDGDAPGCSGSAGACAQNTCQEGRCVEVDVDDDQPCALAGDECQAGVCQAGVCSPTGQLRAGTSVGDQCREEVSTCMTTRYTCNAQAQCVLTDEIPRQEGVRCGGSTSCPFTCHQGVCRDTSTDSQCSATISCAGAHPQTVTGECNNGSCSVSGSRTANTCPGGTQCCQPQLGGAYACRSDCIGDGGR